MMHVYLSQLVLTEKELIYKSAEWDWCKCDYNEAIQTVSLTDINEVSIITEDLSCVSELVAELQVKSSDGSIIMTVKPVESPEEDKQHILNAQQRIRNS